jgi:pSer/pThr/pTyr-binding forkhead associated (FHA) protein
MTHPEVTLTFQDEEGNSRKIALRANRFTIGRGADNDLSIFDPGLSHRHALIERVDDLVLLSDCGSRNGTFLNDAPVLSAAQLEDRDIISIGQCEITVRIVAERVAQKTEASRNDRPAKNSLSATAIAVASVTAVLAATVVLALLFGVERKPAPRARQPVEEQAEMIESQISSPSESKTKADEVSLDQIEKAAAQALRRVSSDDKPYVFPPSAAAALDSIRRKVEQYKQSPELARALKALDREGREVAAEARREGIEPGLVIYTALAETDGGRTGGDTLATARRIRPEIASLRSTFGTELADKALILVAAYRMGGGTRKSHPLLVIMRRAVKDPLTERNVWHLRDSLDPDVFDFVLRFLALGIIAQNPERFGIDAAPLAF